MVLEPIYLDLSSSDDDDDEHNRAGSTALMYLSKVFHVDADDDDVRIIEKPTSNAGVRRNRARVIRSALDDDECCILDTDPGADAVPDIVSSPDADELVMTGEKGPVACRDFPHARYLCVHFPFRTTLHSKFCAQCHCYVCDSLAPCSLWGEGSHPNDHCHASEEPRWKTLRKIAKCDSVPSLATDPTGGSRLVQSSILQHTTKTPPVTQSPVGTPVGSGVALLSQPKVKRDPVVIKLKGKGRGKPSQPPHLGVRSPRPHRVLPLSSYPGRRNRPPPRPTSTPSGKLEEVDSPGPTAAQPPQPTNPHPGRPEGRGTLSTLPPHPRSVPSLNPLSGSGGASRTDILAKKRRPPGGQVPQPTLHPNAAPYSPTVSAPVPNILPSPTSLPPPVANDVLRPPGAGATVPDVVSPAPPVPDSRYVPASTLRDQDVNMGLSSSSQPQAVHRLSKIFGASDVAQRFSSPVNSASSSCPVDILAGPIEGWEVDAAVDFDAFAAGISDVDASPQQVVASLNDVVQQMADEIKRISDVWIRAANFVQETGK